MEPIVRNVRDFPNPQGFPDNCVYIGRSKYSGEWGNPFVIGIHGDRKEVIDKFEEYILSKPEMIQRAKDELKGKDLVCFCAPLACHGDILLRIANER